MSSSKWIQTSLFMRSHAITGRGRAPSQGTVWRLLISMSMWSQALSLKMRFWTMSLKLKTYEGTLAGSAGIPNPPSKQLHPHQWVWPRKPQRGTWSVYGKNIKFPLRISEIESISQKTKLIRYELNDQIHTSLWRRHEHWQKVFHQITSKQKK